MIFENKHTIKQTAHFKLSKKEASVSRQQNK